ncbi:MAG: TrkA family potassium uptake protein [Mariniblastus sp.]
MEKITLSDPSIQRMIQFTAWIALVLILGTAGYSLIEGWNTEDGLYMSVITLATVGYGETQELTGLGRLFTCLLIFVSIICLTCWTACLTSLFVEGDLAGTFKNRKAIKKAGSMNEHTIICGSGTMARTVLEIMVRQQAKVVLIDSDSENLEQIRARYPNISVVHASATDEMALATANVLEASWLVAALESDFENLMISMTCKDLGTDIKVIARSNDLDVASRMMRIGVDKVICPFQLSGEQAAEFALQAVPDEAGSIA